MTHQPLYRQISSLAESSHNAGTTSLEILDISSSIIAGTYLVAFKPISVVIGASSLLSQYESKKLRFHEPGRPATATALTRHGCRGSTRIHCTFVDDDSCRSRTQQTLPTQKEDGENEEVRRKEAECNSHIRKGPMLAFTWSSCRR